MMDYNGADTEVEVYWWNLGAKTLDYRGPIKGLLLQKGIKVRKLPARDKYDSKWRFWISAGTSSVVLTIYEPTFYAAAREACLVHMTMMQDKATFRMKGSPYIYRMNWR